MNFLSFREREVSTLFGLAYFNRVLYCSAGPHCLSGSWLIAEGRNLLPRIRKKLAGLRGIPTS